LALETARHPRPRIEFLADVVIGLALPGQIG